LWHDVAAVWISSGVAVSIAAISDTSTCSRRPTQPAAASLIAAAAANPRRVGLGIAGSQSLCPRKSVLQKLGPARPFDVAFIVAHFDVFFCIVVSLSLTLFEVCL